MYISVTMAWQDTYASWVKRRSFQENTFKWKKNSVEKINVSIQKYVYFPDTCVDNIKVMDMGVLTLESGINEQVVY